jgi:hypothetical protein
VGLEGVAHLADQREVLPGLAAGFAAVEVRQQALELPGLDLVVDCLVEQAEPAPARRCGEVVRELRRRFEPGQRGQDVRDHLEGLEGLPALGAAADVLLEREPRLVGQRGLEELAKEVASLLAAQHHAPSSAAPAAGGTTRRCMRRRTTVANGAGPG